MCGGGRAVESNPFGRASQRLRTPPPKPQPRSLRCGHILPEQIRKRLTKKRKAGQTDAAVDPLSEPDVRAALAKASFEQLIGFQLTDRQLIYNVTR